MNKIYTIFSESHKDLLQIFTDTLFKVEPSCKLTIQSMPQIGAGEYQKPEMYVTALKKVELIIDAINENEDYFCYSDCDVVFLKPFIEDLKKQLLYGYANTLDYITGEISPSYTVNFDLLAQIDYENPLLLCAGFMVIKPSEKTYEFFKMIYRFIEKSLKTDKPLDDQYLLNANRNFLNFATLDKTYCNIGQINGYKQWQGEPFEVPEDVKVFHANWQIGANRKLQCMKMVIDKFKI